MPHDVNCPPALAPQRVTAPADVLALDEVKEFLRVDYDDEDELITALIAAATSHCDGWSGVLGKCLCSQSWRQFFPYFSIDERMRFRLQPVSAITAVTYFDNVGVETTLAAGQYRLLTDDRSPFLAPTPDASWPGTQTRPDAVKVTYTAGYGAAAVVPSSIRLAMKQMIAHWFDNREAVNIGNIVNEIPLSARALLELFRDHT